MSLVDRLAKRKAALQPEQSPAPEAVDHLARLQRTAAARPSSDREDMDRILQLAFVDMMSAEEAEEASRLLLFASSFEKGDRLFREQASGVAAYLTEGGGFFPIGVGWGKTGLSLMVAEQAWKKGLQKMMLMIEPGCLRQLAGNISDWRRMTSLSVPFIFIGGRPPKERRMHYESQRKGCYIVPYSLLSVRDTMDMLEAIDPDLVIADECHNLKDRSTARTKRWMSMMQARERELVAMSGTVTSKSIEDYRHLIDLALKDGSPLPRQGALAHAWGRVLDSGSIITDQCQTGPLEPLVHWANERRIALRRAMPKEEAAKLRHLRLTVSDIRDAYKDRMHSAPGVVASSDSQVKASLTIENTRFDGKQWGEIGDVWSSCEGWAQLEEHMIRVKEEWQTPNGDEIEHAIHIFKWMVELGAGFYNELVWPTSEWVVQRHGISVEQADDALKEFKRVHVLHQKYSKALREWFEHSPPGLDTPMEVARVINQDEDQLPPEVVLPYKVWKAADRETQMRFGFEIERLERAVRVCDFKIRQGVKWAEWAMKEHGSGIIWVGNREMGRWMVDYLKEAGIPCVPCPAGANEQVKQLFDPDHGHANAIAVCSIKAHGTGKNMQRAGAQLFLQWPRDAKQAEQVLGRVHRNKVEKFRDRVQVHTLNLLPYDHVLFGACLVDAVYQHQTGSRRKMVYADYPQLPRIFTPEFLRARGADVEQLDVKQRELMEARFGADWEQEL